MFSIKQSTATAILNQIVTAAGSGAKINLYDGNIPASSDAALSNNNVLARVACGNPCATVSGRVMTFSAFEANVAVEREGTVTFFRLVTSGGNTVLQGTVPDTGGTGNLKLNTIQLQAQGTVTVDSATISIA